MTEDRPTSTQLDAEIANEGTPAVAPDANETPAAQGLQSPDEGATAELPPIGVELSNGRTAGFAGAAPEAEPFPEQAADTEASALEARAGSEIDTEAASIEPVESESSEATGEMSVDGSGPVAEAEPVEAETSPVDVPDVIALGPPAATDAEPAAPSETAAAAPEPEVATATDAAGEAAEAVAQPLETPPEERAKPGDVERFAGVIDHRLVREVYAAPHKVYYLGKIKKAVAAAGETEIGVLLRMVQADILHEIYARKDAKEALCERAEALQDSTSWKATGDAFKALMDEWRQVGAAGRELDDQLWARFTAARGKFNERRAAYFAEREQVWGANREKKEALCAQAETLAESSDWKATADAIRELQNQWKAAGSAGRDHDDALWARFNAAKQKFFDRRSAAWAENRTRKEALVRDAEALQDSTDWRATAEAMKAMQAEWKTIGPAGWEHEDALWSRFRAATQRFFDRRSTTFAERDKNERENLTRKLELIQRAEALIFTGDALASAREARELQAQWKEIGPVPREQAEPIWARFRRACDQIFEQAAGERGRQQNEWQHRMREALIRKREQLNAVRESIAHDEANIERWRETLSTLQPGGKSEEIAASLEAKILDVMERIREKQARAEDLRTSITDIEAKLRE